MLKKLLLIAMTMILVFSGFSPVLTASAKEISDGSTEVFYDSLGNKIELVKITNENEMILETYVNDIFVDYTLRKYENGVLSKEIEYYVVEGKDSTLEQVYSVDEFISNSTTTELSSEEQVYSVDEFISNSTTTELSSEEQALINLNTLSTTAYGNYKTSKYNSTLDVLAFLYLKKTNTVEEIDFSFETGTPVSVIGSAITYVYGHWIVAIAVFLSAVGIEVVADKIRGPLEGVHTTYLTHYDYMVQAYKNGVNTNNFYHLQHDLTVKYNLQRANTPLQTYYKQSSDWLSEDAIMNLGIFAGS